MNQTENHPVHILRYSYAFGLYCKPLTHPLYHLWTFTISGKCQIFRMVPLPLLIFHFGTSKFRYSVTILRPRQNFAGVKKEEKKSTFYRYTLMRIFPIPKFHKTSYSLYGLATRILDLEEMVIKACSVALCLETIPRFPFFTRREGFLIIKCTLDLLQYIKQWGQL